MVKTEAAIFEYGRIVFFLHIPEPFEINVIAFFHIEVYKILYLQ